MTAKKCLKIGLLGSFSLWAFSSQASLDSLATSLISLRSEVEALDDEIKALRDSEQGDLHNLRSQQGELAASVETEKMKTEQLVNEISVLKKNLVEKGGSDAGLKQAVNDGIIFLEKAIQQTAPYHQSRRLSEVDKLKSKIESNQLSSEKAAVQLWSFFEDEYRASTENTILKQVIQIDGQERLVKVAKVGSALLYFQATDGSVGYARKTDEGWSYVLETQSPRIEKIKTVIASFGKQIRTGRFDLVSPRASVQ